MKQIVSRGRCGIALILALVAMSAATPRPAAAGVFMDINFTGEADGAPVVTSTSTTLPLTNPYGVGGFPDTPPYTGSATITNTNGFSNGALLSTNQGGIGANWLDTQFLVDAQIITLNFDINVLAIPGADAGLPQVVPGAPGGQAFAINAFTFSADRIWRFIVTPQADGSIKFGMRGADPAGTFIGLGPDPFNLGETYRVSIAANYITNTVDVSINNVLLADDLAFTTPVAVNAGMSEFFFFQNGVEGVSNQIILDNIVATAENVPEPASLAVWSLLAGVVVIGRLRRRAKQTAAA